MSNMWLKRVCNNPLVIAFDRRSRCITQNIDSDITNVPTDKKTCKAVRGYVHMSSIWLKIVHNTPLVIAFDRRSRCITQNIDSDITNVPTDKKTHKAVRGYVHMSNIRLKIVYNTPLVIAFDRRSRCITQNIDSDITNVSTDKKDS
jgi:NAD-dependent SIR2 family protein deacetylase